MSLDSAPIGTVVARGVGPGDQSSTSRFASGSALRRAITALLSTVLSVVLILAIWRGYLWITGIDHFVGRTPMDVWHHLTSAGSGPDARHALLTGSGTTLRDAAIGLVVGTLAALIFAVVFTLQRGVQQTFMPMALVLQSVPLVAMTPLIALIFGRGLVTTGIITGIVTFFPTLVNVTLALRQVPSQSVDLIRAYGGSPTATLRKVQFPGALPALFASLRIACPLALVGALLAEYLATGTGLGYLMLSSMTNSDYDLLWGAVVLVTLYSIVAYSVITALEGAVLARYAPHQVRARG